MDGGASQRLTADGDAGRRGPDGGESSRRRRRTPTDDEERRPARSNSVPEALQRVAVTGSRSRGSSPQRLHLLVDDHASADIDSRPTEVRRRNCVVFVDGHVAAYYYYYF